MERFFNYLRINGWLGYRALTGFPIIVFGGGDKSSISIAKIQDREKIFQYDVTVLHASHVELRKEKVGIPEHLFFRRIAGSSG